MVNCAHLKIPAVGYFFKKSLSLLLFFGIPKILMSFPFAEAQTIPNQVLPDRFEKRFEDPPLDPKFKKKLKLPKIKKPKLDPKLDMFRFILKDILIEGSTVYKKGDFFSLYKRLLNKEVSMADVYILAGDFTAKYRNDGYILSKVTVPPQRIEKGLIRVKVVEGYISKINIKGDASDSDRLLKKFGKKIRRSRPLKAAVLERYTLLANDLPGLQVKSVLSPSKKKKGASELTFLVKHQVFEGSAGLDNRGSKFSGQMVGSVSIKENSALGLSESTELLVTSSTQTEEVKYAKVTHTEPLGFDGAKFQLSGSLSWTKPGHTLKEFEVQGKSNVVNALITHPWIRTREENLTSFFGFASLNSKTDVLGELSSRDRLRSIYLRTGYDWVDTYGGVNLINFEVRRGFNLLDATRTGTGSLTRARGESDYSKISGGLTRLQYLAPRWMLFTSGAWQYSFSHLLASEEFTVGGSEFGRGYDFSEISGDHGWSAKAELRFAQALRMKYFRDMQYYVFLDYGSVWEKDPGNDTEAQQSIATTGGGIRYNLTRNLSGYFELAKPLAARVESEDHKHFRLFFKVFYRY